MRNFDIKRADIVYSGGGIYVVSGQLADGSYFCGDTANGMMITDRYVSTSSQEWDDNWVIEYLSDEASAQLLYNTYLYGTKNSDFDKGDISMLKDFYQKINNAYTESKYTNSRVSRHLTESVSVEPTIRAWIGNLGKYNEMKLVGAWIDFPIDEDELEQILHDKVLIGTEDEFGQPYEEYGIFDWESDYVEYPGEYVNLEDVNEWAEFVDGLRDWERDVLKMAQEAGYVDDIMDFDSSDYWTCSCTNTSDLGEIWINEVCGGVENLSAESIEEFFDYAALGRELSFDDYDEDEETGEGISAAEYWCGEEYASDYEIGVACVSDLGFEGIQNPENYFDYDAYGESLEQYGYFVDGGFIMER